MYYIDAYHTSPKKTWGIYKPNGELLCICVYKKGAEAMVSHLNELTKGE